jgi:hypothetical protein
MINLRTVQKLHEAAEKRRAIEWKASYDKCRRDLQTNVYNITSNWYEHLRDITRTCDPYAHKIYELERCIYNGVMEIANNYLYEAFNSQMILKIEDDVKYFLHNFYDIDTFDVEFLPFTSEFKIDFTLFNWHEVYNISIRINE